MSLAEDPRWQEATIAANRAKTRSLKLQTFILWMSLVPVIVIALAVLIVIGIFVFG